jgi:organic hydroperoxide reductase OsmC/OhrA
MIARILYAAEATVEGGLEGHARTADGPLDLPAEMGGSGGLGTNPEQLALRHRVCGVLPVQSPRRPA